MGPLPTAGPSCFSGLTAALSLAPWAAQPGRARFAGPGALASLIPWDLQQEPGAQGLAAATYSSLESFVAVMLFPSTGARKSKVEGRKQVLWRAGRGSGAPEPGVLPARHALGGRPPEHLLHSGAKSSAFVETAFSAASGGNVFHTELKCSQLHKTSELPASLGSVRVQ